MKNILILLLLTYFAQNLFAQKTNTFERASEAYLMSEYEEAKSLYTTLLIEGDDEWNYFIYYRRAYCYYELEQLEEAKKDAKKALGINSKHKDYKNVKGGAFFLMAAMYSHSGDHEKSIEYLSYITKMIDESYIWNNIGYSQLKLERYNAALESFNKSLELNLDNAYALSNRSLAYLRLGDVDQAKIDVNKSLELDANDPYTYKYKALIHLELNEMDKVCEALAKSKEMGYEHFNKGRSKDAQEVNNLIMEHCSTSKEE
jgi:tetratricopeptide (TPR) repeat protein